MTVTPRVALPQSVARVSLVNRMTFTGVPLAGVAKAWSAAQLSLHGTLQEIVSLDRVIKVMKRTGDDMRREYKETSEGGLAVSLPEC